MGQIFCNAFIEILGNSHALAVTLHQEDTLMGKLTIGETIRALRQAKGISLTKLEELSGINNGNLSKIECGKRGMSHTTMQAIADGLGVSLSDLFADQSLPDVKMLPKKYGEFSGQRVDSFSELKLIPEGINVAIECIRVVPRSESIRGWMKDPAATITFLADHLRSLDCKPESLAAHLVKDDAMLPRLCSGDSIVIDTDETDIPDTGGVFAIIFDTRTVSIRRLFVKPGGGLLIVCDNNHLPSMTLSPAEAENIVIVGRVKIMQGSSGF